MFLCAETPRPNVAAPRNLSLFSPRVLVRGSLPSRSPLSQPGIRRGRRPSLEISKQADDLLLETGGRSVKLTNLRKVFWPELWISKGDLLRYYASVAPFL